MRKFFIISIILIVLLAGLRLYYLSTSKEVELFSLHAYSSYIEDFPSDIVLGEISSAEQAKNAAEKIWYDIYGQDSAESKPYTVYYDEENKVWLVHGNLNSWKLEEGIEFQIGGVPYIIIDKDNGCVLAVWHDK